jgi:hypothetical protein
VNIEERWRGIPKFINRFIGWKPVNSTLDLGIGRCQWRTHECRRGRHLTELQRRFQQGGGATQRRGLVKAIVIRLGSPANRLYWRLIKPMVSIAEYKVPQSKRCFVVLLWALFLIGLSLSIFNNWREHNVYRKYTSDRYVPNCCTDDEHCITNA